MPRSDIPVETLIQQLHSSDWTARCDAARLLGQSRDPRAVEALLPDLTDSDWRVRRNAAQALGALGDPRAVAPLMQTLHDRVMTVRQRAVVALGRIKDLQALPALLEILLEGKRESYEAARAVRKFGKKALPEIAKAYEQTGNQQLMMLLIEMKYQGAFDLILKLLESPDPSARLTAIRELGNSGNRKAIPYLLKQTEQTDPMLQSEAVRALGKLGAVETASFLLNLLVDDELYGARSGVYHAVTEAFQSFGGFADQLKNAFPGNYPAMFQVGGAPISLPEAMGFLGSNPLNEMLSRFQGGEPVPAEMPDLPSDLMNKTFEEMAWKFGVMFADARDASQERVKHLVQLLKAESSLTRVGAALTLPWYTNEASLITLEDAARDPDERVRTAAQWALQALQKALLYRKQSGL
ncbi:MAG: HEAT repeat domain-containing protein [Chloroflexota bacterium]|nr:HEAT repeat domain-containing protein [Chloroflexota bacterium]